MGPEKEYVSASIWSSSAILVTMASRYVLVEFRGTAGLSKPRSPAHTAGKGNAIGNEIWKALMATLQ